MAKFMELNLKVVSEEDWQKHADEWFNKGVEWHRDQMRKVIEQDGATAKETPAEIAEEFAASEHAEGTFNANTPLGPIAVCVNSLGPDSAEYERIWKLGYKGCQADLQTVAEQRDRLAQEATDLKTAMREQAKQMRRLHDDRDVWYGRAVSAEDKITTHLSINEAMRTEIRNILDR